MLFSPSLLASELEKHFPDILFAFLFGSSQQGEVRQGGDIDLAVWLKDYGKRAALITDMIGLTESLTEGVTCDLTLLNNAGEQLAFEALSGTRLFVREEAMDQYVAWYSLTCREYEDTMAWKAKQLQYRGYEVQWGH